MKLRMFQVDAFTDRVFGGNPAAIVPLEAWLPDGTMLAIARENNLAETAFLVPSTVSDEGAGGRIDYHIRWFTPELEIDLCGHATLASAFALRLWLGWTGHAIRFSSASGPLGARFLEDGFIELDFPSRPPLPCAPMEGLAEALGGKILETSKSRDWVVLLEGEGAVRALKPDYHALARIPASIGIAATARADPGSGCDFVSRFFAPAAGIPEDPVTGSSHSTLVPYWAAKLGKDRMVARQVSARGGYLRLRLGGDRVGIAGQCAAFMEGWIEV